MPSQINSHEQRIDALATSGSKAQRLGAGFLDQAGQFVAYRGTILQMRSKAWPGD